MLELYRFPGATCAAKVLFALAEKSVAFEDRVISRADLASDWYRKLNPNGVVPTIVHDGETIIESGVILNYIEDAYPEPALRPAEPLQRARMNYWMKVADDALGSLGTLTYAIAVRPQLLSRSAQEREAYYATIADPQLRTARRNAIELGLDALEAVAAIDALATLQQRVDATVRERGFLAGDFSLADVSIAPIIWRLDHLGLLKSTVEIPAFHKWWSAICARPAFAVGVTASTPPEIISGLQAAAAAAAAGRGDYNAALLKAAGA